MFNVVLVEPEIPANTGNIGRTCVVTGTRLHLVGPLAFDLSEKALHRAGLGYWGSLDVVTYADWDDLCARNPQATGAQLHLLTKHGARTYAQSNYHDDDWLVFGKESSGLDATLLATHSQLCERIPMRSDDALTNARPWQQSFSALHPELSRDICGNFVDRRVGQITSLNLSNAVAIVLFEALRQLDFPGM